MRMILVDFRGDAPGDGWEVGGGGGTDGFVGGDEAVTLNLIG